VAVFVMTVFADDPETVAAARARLERAWDDWGLTGETRSGAVGTPAEVAEQLRAWTDAGVSHLVLQPMADADRTAFLYGAGEVAQLLR
jgi:alkanesulfonate monooxygenase SsuD/methylene tetrahydromethanopterin reductase-like flavin-dependent oxidoreductase (luciferase family)